MRFFYTFYVIQNLFRNLIKLISNEKLPRAYELNEVK